MKKEKINGLTINRFEKKDLTEKIKMSEDDAKLVMKYQKTFPELLVEDTNEFVINARVLWEELSKPQSEFKKWIDRKMLPFFKKNVDYINIDRIVDIGKTNISRKQIEYYFTVDVAKNIAMSTGMDMKSSEEVRAKGRLVRDYFIKVERALKGITDWIRVREPQKEGYKKLTNTLNRQYILTHDGDKPESKVFSDEADMINENLLGAKAKKIREELGVSDKQTREHLCTEVNQALADLQMVDESLIIGNIDFETRKNIIDTTCKCRYAKLKQAVYEELLIAM